MRNNQNAVSANIIYEKNLKPIATRLRVSWLCLVFCVLFLILLLLLLFGAEMVHKSPLNQQQKIIIKITQSIYHFKSYR